jgi:putative SOS response-associated peptidase YedK
VCGRFSQGEPSKRISDLFGAEADDDLPAGLWNVPPTEAIRIVVAADGRRRLVGAAWGFQPPWAAEGAGRAWINARAETAWESAAFGPAIRRTRCFVPADAFYEWDRTVSPRQPYAIGPTAADGMLALAGIWTAGRDRAPTVAILTTTPNDLVARVHDRMPVILEPDDLDAWLDPGAGRDELAPMLGPAPVTTVRMWPVGTAVNRVGVDGPELLRAVEPAPTLGLL